jgi:class 3 adenylate cyclase
MATMDAAEPLLLSARDAVTAHDWQAAFDGFVAADAVGTLSGEDLDAMADAAYFSSHPTKAIEASQRAYAAYLDSDRRAEAALAALVACRLHFAHSDMAAASGWTERARRLLVDLPECPAHGMLAWLEGQLMIMLKGHEQALERAREVEAIGSRLAERDLVALGRAMQGFLCLHSGDVSGGMPLLDEAVAGAIAGELGPFATAEIVCEMVVSCLDLADYQRASEWLETADRAGRQIASFPGCCRTHKATVLRHRGDWPEAQRQAHQARAELIGVEVLHEGMALTEIGELHRCKGELALAEKAFGEAYEKGWPPQPGLALVLLAQGDSAGAAQMIQRAIARCTDEPASLIHLLPAQVEVATAIGDVKTAIAAGDRLSEAASSLGTSAALAASACVTGLSMQLSGNLTGAVRELEQSIRLWQKAHSPYQAALSRMRLAVVLEALGDDRSARLELSTARTTFERLGAAPEAREAARRLGDERPRRLTSTFMFTDIVNSTLLLTAIGDDAWHGVRQWHDRTMRDVIGTHLGRIIKETGDGFFATFDDPALAVEAAVVIQRALAEHRRTDGFAPVVRIGLHVGSALLIDDDYTGRDVVVAARIGALASADEILMSSDLASCLGPNFRIEPRSSQLLKGIPEPIEIVAVDWRW